MKIEIPDTHLNYIISQGGNDSAPVVVRPNVKIFKGIPDMILYYSVFFILIIFFMLCSNFVPIHGVAVNLPVSGGEMIYSPRDLIVTLDGEGRLYFNDAPVENEDSLKSRLLASISHSASRIVFRCDSGVQLPQMLKLLALAEELNTNALFMTTAPAKEKEQSSNFSEQEQ